MQWKTASNENPGYSVYYADDQTREGHRYVAQRKRGNGFWRLFHRSTPNEPLRTIYAAETLKECKAYADEYQTLLGAMNQ
ncbi:MAG: hypothetical protein KDE19_02600 [Caldilineaceae bacterium]|nr:hypothetical protein [Caldilineaceae bacterium]